MGLTRTSGPKCFRLDPQRSRLTPALTKQKSLCPGVISFFRNSLAIPSGHAPGRRLGTTDTQLVRRNDGSCRTVGGVFSFSPRATTVALLVHPPSHLVSRKHSSFYPNSTNSSAPNSCGHHLCLCHASHHLPANSGSRASSAALTAPIDSVVPALPDQHRRDC